MFIYVVDEMFFRLFLAVRSIPNVYVSISNMIIYPTVINIIIVAIYGTLFETY